MKLKFFSRASSNRFFFWARYNHHYEFQFDWNFLVTREDSSVFLFLFSFRKLSFFFFLNVSCVFIIWLCMLVFRVCLFIDSYINQITHTHRVREKEKSHKIIIICHTKKPCKTTKKRNHGPWTVILMQHPTTLNTYIC